jgi:poly-gamma-glutamate synthesis protein (capsule biosynthesis protein)
MYRERGWTVFAGGENLEAARAPALLEHNGNRLAFVGCNSVGPNGAWATDDQPGAAPCGDMQWLLERVRALREEGYLPVVTFQYAESYAFNPSPAQEEAFRAVAEAGAVIVSGSQAHYPQIMEFHEGAFIHYGLGNLFFDQMDDPVVGTRWEFIDRHIFYGGRHIQTELLPALLMDYARPRPMDAAERESFLRDVFSAAGW